MQTQPDPSWSFRISRDMHAELDAFADVVEQFGSRRISDGQFRIIRVPAGVYEQRENGTYMLRVRSPAGGVTPSHLRRLGEASARFGNGVLHVTTRQEFQLHRVPLESILPALRSLAEVGLSTKGGGGNTDPAGEFDAAPSDVAALVASVRVLHESLDASLRFKAAVVAK